MSFNLHPRMLKIITKRTYLHIHIQGDTNKLRNLKKVILNCPYEVYFIYTKLLEASSQKPALNQH